MKKKLLVLSLTCLIFTSAAFSQMCCPQRVPGSVSAIEPEFNVCDTTWSNAYYGGAAQVSTTDLGQYGASITTLAELYLHSIGQDIKVASKTNIANPSCNATTQFITWTPTQNCHIGRGNSYFSKFTITWKINCVTGFTSSDFRTSQIVVCP